MAGPLSHIRVLDLSRIMAGPWAGQILADLGADVVKVERPGLGDDTRAWGPPFLKDRSGAETREAGYFLCVNRGKRSITIELDKPEGQRVVRALAARSDIVLENFKVGTLKRFGLGYDDLKAVNPGLIYCSITGFGQSGPYSHRPGYDFVIQGMGGIMDITGEAAGEPQKPGVAYADVFTGVYSALAIQSALLLMSSLMVVIFELCSISIYLGAQQAARIPPARKTVPVQPVDATPSNQLIHKCFP